MITPGKHSLSNHDYHADKTHFSSSILKEALESAAHFKFNILQGNKVTDSDNKNFILGNAVHTIILEPHLFDEQYIVVECDANKDGSIPVKDLRMAISKHGEGKTFISQTQYNFAVKARENTLKYPDAAKLLFSTTGESEPSFFAKCDETGLQLKVRPDRIDLDNKFIVDTKTSYSADKYEFTKIIKYDRHYDLSAYMYVKQVYDLTGVICDYYWHVIEKSDLCPVAIYKASQATLEDGKKKFFRACDNIKSALAMPDDVLYQNEIEEI